MVSSFRLWFWNDVVAFGSDLSEMKKVLIQILICFFSVSQFAFTQNPSNDISSLDGKWQIELNSNDVGVVRTVFNFESQKNSFKAYTRKNADRAILGFWKSTLARIFTDDFKKGSLLRITDGKLNRANDTIYLSGIFRSAMGNYYFDGTVVNDSLNATLRNSKKKLKGRLKGLKNPDIEYPLDNYPDIVAEAIDTSKTKIYDREITNTKEWKSFENSIAKKSLEFKDDIELVFAFYYFSSKLPISHFALTRTGQAIAQQSSEPERQLRFEEISKDIALLEIKTFSGSANEVDSIFAMINEERYDHLIVDFRNNPGGSVEAGMSFARNVVDTSTSLTGGIFLTQRWFNENDSIPTVSEYKGFLTFSEANYDLIIEGIHCEKGLVLKVKPYENPYQGELYLIVNENTASTCEPIVYSLKKHKLATVVGKTTAGAMLNGEQFILSSGFSLFVPTADYYTSDGFRIDQNGVEPDVELNDQQPVEYIIENLID